MRAPNTFIIGAPKSGTTSLADYLAAHPAAYVCSPKEPFFWAEDYPGLAQRLGIRSLEEYLRLFSSADARHEVVAEASTNYLCSRTAVSRIREYCPTARFIVVLRDPVEVAHAFHMEQVFAGNEDVTDFAAAWQLQERRRRGDALPRACWAPRFLQYEECVRFGEQVERLLAEVEPGNVLFLRFEDVRADVAGVWARVLEFLSLLPDGRREFPVSNAAHGHRLPGLARFLFQPPGLLRAPVEALRAHLRQRRYAPIEFLKARLRRPVPRAVVVPAFEAELRRGLAPDIRKLQVLLGWDLSAWSGESLACARF
jgi:hypothetical protein